MNDVRLVQVALLGEGALAGLAIVWARWRGLSLEAGPVLTGLVVGSAAAAVFALVNLYLLCQAPAVAPVRSIRRLYGTLLKPVFSRIGAGALIAISLAAGIAEEIFFRGVLQAELGLLPASVLFGIAHMHGAASVAFGCWVGVMGLVLGWLSIMTDGLLAPIVAHSVYDACALGYIRWGRDCQAVRDVLEPESEESVAGDS